jgi:Protein of unknown function (DUF1488)
MQPQPQLRCAVQSWDGDRLSFEVDNGGRRFGCWMSRKTLASAGPGYKARRWQLLEAVERLWPRIEQIALAKIKAASAQPIGQAMTISIDELNDLPLAIP